MGCMQSVLHWIFNFDKEGVLNVMEVILGQIMKYQVRKFCIINQRYGPEQIHSLGWNSEVCK
jgi:hypothetical protein